MRETAMKEAEGIQSPGLKSRSLEVRVSADADMEQEGAASSAPTRFHEPFSVHAGGHWLYRRPGFQSGEQRRRTYASVLIMVLFLLLTLGTAQAAAPNGPPVGGQAPAFVLPDVQGKPFRLEDHKGQTLVLNFWAFWCDTWKAELPSLTELSDRQEELGFRLVAVSVDGTRLSEFARRTTSTVPFPVLLDGGGRVSARYRVHHVPTVVILGPDGVVRFTANGYPGNSVVLRELRKIAPGEMKITKGRGKAIRRFPRARELSFPHLFIFGTGW